MARKSSPARAATATGLVLRFEEERETKGTIRFSEVMETDLDEPKVGTLYVRKSTLAAIGFERGGILTVSIEA